MYARQVVRIIGDLFGVLLEGATKAARARLICDFVGGMTDSQASQSHERLFDARQSSPVAPL